MKKHPFLEVSQPSHDGSFWIINWTDAIQVSEKIRMFYEGQFRLFSEKGFRYVVPDSRLTGPLQLLNDVWSPEHWKPLSNALGVAQRVEELKKLSWKEVIANAIDEANRRRRRYNQLLNNLFLVKEVQFETINHFSKTSITPIPERDGGDYIPAHLSFFGGGGGHQMGEIIRVGHQYSRSHRLLVGKIFTYNPPKEHAGYISLLYSGSLIEGRSETLLSIIVKKSTLKPLSMLTARNFWQEAILEPEPIKREPWIR